MIPLMPEYFYLDFYLEEIELYSDLRYRAWKRDFHISGKKYFHEWFNREFFIGELVTHLSSESNELFEFLERFMKELPCTRETVEDLMKYAYDIDRNVILMSSSEDAGYFLSKRNRRGIFVSHNNKSD